ncbi:hypothetical protein ES708_26396 [subsurface metagenome]
MPRLTKDDWKAWDEEKKRFAEREAGGFAADLKALEQHIAKLREVAPKDKAGWPHNIALTYLNQLQMNLDSIKSYVAGGTA